MESLYGLVRKRPDWEHITWVVLLHARFARAHRDLKEELIRREFGPEEEYPWQIPSVILVATQAIEVGLDITCRTLITELHNASRRHPEMAKLLQAWHTDNSSQLRVAAGLRKPEEKMYYLLLLGLSHLDALAGMGVSQEEIEDEAVKLLEGWLAYRYP